MRGEGSNGDTDRDRKGAHTIRYPADINYGLDNTGGEEAP